MIASRPAQSADHAELMNVIAQARAAIAELGIDQWQDGYPEPELIASDIENGIGRTFTVDGKIASYMVPLLEPEPIYDTLKGEWVRSGPYLTVHRMAIGDGFRGTGLATAMLDYAETLALESGCVSVRADTHTGNLRMRRLLEKRGYVYCGTVEYAVTAGDPIRVAYEKPLKKL